MNESVAKQRENNGPSIGGVTGKGFMPGQSGNPTGRPKGAVSLTRLVREALEKSEIKVKADDSDDLIVKKLPDGLTVSDLLASMIVNAALQGDFRFAKELWDRIDGKVPDKLDAAVTHTSADDLTQALKAKTEDNPDARKALAQALYDLGAEDEQTDPDTISTHEPA